MAKEGGGIRGGRGGVGGGNLSVSTLAPNTLSLHF